MCKKKDYRIFGRIRGKSHLEIYWTLDVGKLPMVSLLAEKYPDRHYTGLDLTQMIEQAKKKNISNAAFVVRAVSFPFENDSF